MIKNMKKNQKKSNLGRLVLTCTDFEDLRRQVQDDTELAERDAIPMRDVVVEKYDAWLELYRSKNK